MANDLILPGMQFVDSQFWTLDGAFRDALCGVNAANEAESWATQVYHSLPDRYAAMRAAGRCAPDGATTLPHLLAQLAADGLTAGRQPADVGWRAFFDAHVGREAILYETARGQVLRDAISGQGEDATDLRYHFLLVVGYHATSGPSDVAHGRTLPVGWWCVDGCNSLYNPVAGGTRRRVRNARTLVFYPDTLVAASQPVGALAVAAKIQIGASPVWHVRSDGFYADSAGHVAGGAMGRYLADHGLLAVDGLASETYYAGGNLADAFLPLANGQVVTAHKLTQDGKLVWQVRADEGAALLATYYAQAHRPPAPAPDDRATKALIELNAVLESLPKAQA